jgi:hypothetical protein
VRIFLYLSIRSFVQQKVTSYQGILYCFSISHIMHQISLIILFVAIIQLNYACYITNCPIGGKRSLFLNDHLLTHQVRH